MDPYISVVEGNSASEDSGRSNGFDIRNPVSSSLKKVAPVGVHLGSGHETLGFS